MEEEINISPIFSFSLDKLKEIKWQEIKQLRDTFEFSSFMFDGRRYDCDQISATRIMGATLAQQPVTWKTADNEVVQLSVQDVQGLYGALAIHVNTAHARSRAAREALDSATTIEQINQVQF